MAEWWLCSSFVRLDYDMARSDMDFTGEDRNQIAGMILGE
jgi:hypothetical protein